MTSHDEAATHLLSEIESSEKIYYAFSRGEKKKIPDEKIGKLRAKLNCLVNGTIYGDNKDVICDREDE